VTCLNSSPLALADLLDIVETALATVSRRLPTHVGRDDLASTGKLALVRALAHAAGGEDEIRAYCFVRVRGAMLDELRRLDSLSRNRRDQAKAIACAQRAVASQHGREATLDEVAEITGFSIRTIVSILNARTAEAELDETDWNTVPDAESPSPLETVELTDLHAGLHAALTRLPANQAHALRRYYLEEATLDAIAAELCVSRERARQIREAGEKKLRADLTVLSLWQALFAQS